MTIDDHMRNHAYCLEQAARLLGAPVRAIALGWDARQLLGSRMRLEVREGLGAEFPLLRFTSGPRGQQLEHGLERYRIDTEDGPIRLVRVRAPDCSDRDALSLYLFWAVPVDQHRRLYRLLRRLERNALAAAPPVMREADRRQLWDNTVGFLRQGRAALHRYGLPQKRGVMLLGEPGNGKTMACRWLSSHCQRQGLEWKSVSAEQYETARQDNEVRSLFELDGPGIVLFDDLDEALRERDEALPGNDRTTFLTELDGLRPREGIVYLFTSNLPPARLDPAVRRPGRIDLLLHFPRPDAALRREFICERWHAEIVAALDVEMVVADTEGLSFAELEEVKKQLVLGHFDHGRWDWDAAWLTYREGRADGTRARRIGFEAAAGRNASARRPCGANRV